MSRSTPRKSRHRHHPSNAGARVVQASDYESDAAHYLETRDAPPTAPRLHRTNTDLNMSVLRRYMPDIRAILSVAANAVVYNFEAATQSWDKAGVEGTLFVVDREPLVVDANGRSLPRVCVFVLNRRGLNNLAIDMLKVSDCEEADGLLIFRLVDDGHGRSNDIGEPDDADNRVVGLWIHADEDDTRRINATVINAAFHQAKQVTAEYVASMTAMVSATVPLEMGAGSAPGQVDLEPTGTGSALTGKRLSISELFNGKNGNL